MTDFSNKVSILSELWMNYRSDEQLHDFIEYNDLGLPLAYFVHNEMVTPSEQAKDYINETYHLFVFSLGVEDKEYGSLEEMLIEAEKNGGSE